MSAVHLSEAQIADFDREGFVFLESVFSEAEVDLLSREADRIFALDRKEVIREASGKAARMAFAPHTYSEIYGVLYRHPRLIGPVKQLLRADVYMHQFKINAKAAFDGEIWQWHQDFGVWHRDDMMPEPKAMNISVFLDDVTVANGPLMFIPGSHKKGVIEAGHDVETTTFPLWTLDQRTIARLADESRIEAPLGPKGSVLMFHGNLVHASPPNISPYDRKITYLSLCDVDNHIRRFARPEWIAFRDFTPIRPLGDDCLSRGLLAPTG
ncbi:MAG: phytanoyl-CoA dioxygenase family protein [Alphaproteobacteria bacterium]|nr:phytanoyl-CoA dioxygenase family protein [Alphaproteobacteria bacterium]